MKRISSLSFLSAFIGIIVAFVLFSPTACKVKSKKDIVKSTPFPYNDAPIIGSIKAQNQWATEHFWDKFFDTARHFSPDTSLVLGVTKSNFTIAFQRYAANLPGLSTSKLLSTQEALMHNSFEVQKKYAESSIYKIVADLSYRYFYEPNSPFRNEEAYIPVLEHLIEHSDTDVLSKEKYQKDLKLTKLNRLGKKASDFRYELKGGKRGSLYSIKSKYTLLLFTNPDCHSCAEIIRNFANSKEINSMIENKNLTVLNVYIDEDISSWFAYSEKYPDNWINAYDPELAIRSNELYNIRATPTLYLFDEDKNTILKDPDAKIIYDLLIQYSLR